MIIQRSWRGTAQLAVDRLAAARRLAGLLVEIDKLELLAVDAFKLAALLIKIDAVVERIAAIDRAIAASQRLDPPASPDSLPRLANACAC
jgi:hypothetical protein